MFTALRAYIFVYPGVITFFCHREKFSSSPRNDKRLTEERQETLREKILTPKNVLFYANWNQFPNTNRIEKRTKLLNCTNTVDYICRKLNQCATQYRVLQTIRHTLLPKETIFLPSPQPLPQPADYTELRISFWQNEIYHETKMNYELLCRLMAWKIHNS